MGPQCEAANWNCGLQHVSNACQCCPPPPSPVALTCWVEPSGKALTLQTRETARLTSRLKRAGNPAIVYAGLPVPVPAHCIPSTGIRLTQYCQQRACSLESVDLGPLSLTMRNDSGHWESPLQALVPSSTREGLMLCVIMLCVVADCSVGHNSHPPTLTLALAVWLALANGT